MLSTTARVLSIGLFTLLPVGCTRYRSPIVTVGEAVIVERTNEATQISIELELSNPNHEPLVLRTFSYAVDIAGHKTFTGKRSAEATLGSQTTKSFRLPAVIVPDVGGAAVAPGDAWSLRGGLLYVTPGELAEILLDSGVRRPRVGLAGAGQLAGRP